MARSEISFPTTKGKTEVFRKNITRTSKQASQVEVQESGGRSPSVTAVQVGAKFDDGLVAGEATAADVERRCVGGMPVINCRCCLGDVAMGSVVCSK